MCHDVIQPSPEFRHLGAAELDRAIDDATLALEAAREALLSLQDERFARYYTASVLGRSVVDAGATLGNC